MIEVGDMLICVDAGPSKDYFAPHSDESPVTKIEKGKMYRLTGLVPCIEGFGLLINDEAPHTCGCCKGANGWHPDRFKKLPPAEPEFIQLIRSLKTPTKIREDA